MSLFRKALRVGFNALNKVTEESALYLPVGDAVGYALLVTPGLLSDEVLDVTGGMFAGRRRDFLVDRSRLEGLPEAGDVVEFGGESYEVRPLHPEGPEWEWSDAANSRLRVHSVLVSS